MDAFATRNWVSTPTITATLRIATAYSVKLPVNSRRVPDQRETQQRRRDEGQEHRDARQHLALRRRAGGEQAPVLGRQDLDAQGGVVRRRHPTPRARGSAAAGRVIVPCGHHAPGAHRRHSIHAEGWSDAHPAFRRRLFAVPALVLSLAACAPEDDPETPDTAGTDTPVACAPSGPISEAVEVTGDFDTDADRRRSRPRCRLTATQRTVVTEGDGTEVQDGAQTQVHFTLYNGETGEAVDVDRIRSDDPSRDRRRGPLPAGTGEDPPLLHDRLPHRRGRPCRRCLRRRRQRRPRDRRRASPWSSCIDLVSVVPTQAEGESSPLPEFPEVTWADDGRRP